MQRPHVSKGVTLYAGLMGYALANAWASAKKLFCGCENAWAKVSHAENEAGSRAEFCKPERRSGIKPQTRRLYLCAEAKLADAFGAEWCRSPASILSTVDLAEQIYVICEPVNTGQTV